MSERTGRARALSSLAVLIVFVSGAVACARSTDTGSRSESTGTVASTDPSDRSDKTSDDRRTNRSAGERTPRSSGEGPGTTKRSAKINADVTSCGTIDGVAGWPTTMAPSRRPQECLLEAFPTGQHKRMVVARPTDGKGKHPAVTYYEVTGPGALTVVEDRREAADEPKTLTAKRCTVLTKGSSYVPDVGECSDTEPLT